MNQKNTPESAADGQSASPPNDMDSLTVSELRFRTMFEQSPFSTQIFSPDGRCLHGNKAWERLWNTSLDQLAGYNIFEDQQIIDKGLMPSIKAGFAGETVSIPALLYDPADIGREGRPRWVEAYIYSIKTPSNEVEEVVLVLRDVTERKTIEAELREQTETLETLNRIGQVLSAELDFQKLIQALTDAATELCGARFGSFFYNVEDEETPSYMLFTLSGVPREHFSGFPMPRATDLFGPTFKGEGVIRIDDVKQDPRYGKWSPYYGLPPGHLPVTSYLAVPVVSRSGDVLGGLFFGHPDRGVFTDREERRVVGLAAQAAVAIDNARLFELARRERRQVEASERRYRAVAEAIPQMVWVVNPDGSFDYFNRRWYEFTGLSEAESIGEGWQSVIHPDDLQGSLDRWDHALRTGDIYEVEHRIRRGSDSTYRWHLSRAHPLKDEEQHIFKWFGTSTDIDDQKRAGENQRFLAEASTVLASSLNYEVTLASVANLAVSYIADWCAVDILEDGRVKRIELAHKDRRKVEMLKEWQRLYPPDHNHPEPLGRALSDGHSEIRPEVTDKLLREVARSEEHFATLRTLGLKSYMIVPLLVRNRPVGAITFLTAESGRSYTEADLSLAEDLARRAAVAVDNSRLYRESREASRLKDEFLATVSHELRTPLNAILGWARMLRGGKISGEEAAQATEVIERNARSQAQLIEDLLDVSRIITGKLRLDIRPIDLVNVVNLAIDSVRPAAEAKGVRLETVLDPLAGSVSGDPDRLQQVIWNLLSNAIKFTPRGGRTQVRLERFESQVEVVVSDTGQGIDPEFLPFVFDRFRQGDSTLTRAYGGLGLGLSIVRHLVEMHGGMVRAESEGPGKGATFSVRLPIRVARASGEQEGDPGPLRPEAVDHFSFDSPPDLSGARVLVVDDDPDARVLIEALLSKCKARVKTFGSASEALEGLASWKPDVIVSDIEMPGEDGYSLIRKVRALESASGDYTPAIALTAHARPEDRLRALAAGYQMHVPKPVEPAELALVISTLVRRRQD